MPRGGYRPGAGRPRKVLAGAASAEREIEIPAERRKAGPAVTPAPRPTETPLEYMLRVMRDETADPNLRSRMCIAAAPYLHAKAEPAEPLGKKQRAERDALTAHNGSEWELLLNDRLPLANAPSPQVNWSWDRLINGDPTTDQRWADAFARKPIGEEDD